MEHEEQKMRDTAERAEGGADVLEERTEQLGEEIEETRQDWERKREDASVPGAPPPPGERPPVGSEEEERPPPEVREGAKDEPE